jgi:hypothetical protein
MGVFIRSVGGSARCVLYLVGRDGQAMVIDKRNPAHGHADAVQIA